MVIEGGSAFVALLNVVIPIVQITLALLLHKPLRRKVGRKNNLFSLHQRWIWSSDPVCLLAS